MCYIPANFLFARTIEQESSTTFFSKHNKSLNVFCNYSYIVEYIVGTRWVYGVGKHNRNNVCNWPADYCFEKCFMCLSDDVFFFIQKGLCNAIQWKWLIRFISFCFSCIENAPQLKTISPSLFDVSLPSLKIL